MLVSAISPNFNKGYTVSNNTPFNTRSNETIGDTVFNSLTPYISKKSEPAEKSQQDFRNINEWMNFCHHQIVGDKLDVIA